LRRAAQAARAGEVGSAEAICNAVLRYSPNDPFALNLLASLHRSRGDLVGARTTQELACRVRPHDPSLAYNLALVCRMQGDLGNARAQCQRALRAAPDFSPATTLLAELDSPASFPRRVIQAGISNGET
jgi:Flp pilus assembly protein TadD